jgi:filamentous hemagglutinin family protein
MKTKTNKQLRIGITLGLMLGVSVYGTGWAAPATNAVPTGNTNVTGANTVTTAGSTSAPVMTVAQDKTVLNAQINWNTFNIGQNATVNFNQASTGSTMINNVVGNNMSEIAGKMNATGNIVLINPNGTTFYNGATINVGGLAVYAAKSTDLTSDANKLNEANIVIESGVTINAGISAAIAQATAMGIKPEELAIGIAANSNKIRLVANGNVTINDGAVLKALDSTTMSGYTAVGEEAFQLGGNANISTGEVIIRPDANANDYGTLTINGTPKVETTKASIFYNPTLVGTATTADGVTYNKKNFAAEQDFTTMMDTTAQTGVTDVKAQSGDSLKLVEAGGEITKEETRGITTKTASGTGAAIARMLVNNVAQLQDIDTYINSTTKNNDYGNLGGKYALGKNIDAKSDSSSVVANGIVYAMSDGTVKAVSTQDSGQITSATTKTVLNNTVTLTYAAVRSQLPALPALIMMERL